MNRHRDPFERRARASALFLIVLGLGCSHSESGPRPNAGDQPSSDVASVYVVNYPLQYFAQRIGGDRVKVVFPAPPDVDPAFWRPDSQVIAAFQKADLILLNGAGYAKWTSTVSLPESKLINTSESSADDYITVEDAVTHSHGPGEVHAHAGIAFTTWLDPQIAIAQAKSICEALAGMRPQFESEFQERLEQLVADLQDIDRSIGQTLQGHTKDPIVFSHPVYQYLVRYGGLNARSVHWEPDSVPTEKMRQELASLLETHPSVIMIWEGEPITENQALLDEIDLRSVVFDPCGNVPAEGDYVSVMRKNAENLAAAFAHSP